MGIRGKLFLTSVLLIVSTGIISLYILEQQTRRWLTNRIKQELIRDANTAKILLEATSPPLTTLAIHPTTHRLAKSFSARVTITDFNGKVLGDSKLPLARISTLPNHGNRQEIIDARIQRIGQARRFSETLNAHTHYVAIRFTSRAQQAIVRISMSLQELTDASWNLRFFIFFLGIIGLFIATLMSALASHLMSRTLRILVENARKIAQGKGSPTLLADHSKDELGFWIGSFNQSIVEWERLVSVLTNEKNRFEAILKSMNAAVLVLDHHQRVTMDNPSALSCLGLTSSPLGQHLSDFIESPEMMRLVEETQQGRSIANEFSLSKPIQRSVIVRATPLKGLNGTVLIIHDVTELRKLETIRRDFVANVSHELRTPLSIIQANVETLLDGALNDPKYAKGYLESSYKHAKRLSYLIDDLLDLSQIEAGKIRLEKISFAIALPIQLTIDAIIGAKDKKMNVHNHVDNSLYVRADPKAFEQIFLNLFDNAVKYTPEFGNITVQAFKEGSFVRIEVQDDGPGLAPSHQERIFERFYRVDPGRSRQIGGTGLGLAIAKHLTLSMHGQIGVESSSAHGSIFWFTLPLAQNE